VIQNSDVEELEGLLQAFGDVDVGLGGFRYAARVIVGEDDGSAVDGAAEEIVAGDELVTFGEIDHAEGFVIEGAN
jgi:hypothetical protein